ncbi:MAG TPA: hypothetical protein DDZ76_05600 [Xanthomonadales bacterium]|nr:hypothetical protein [Xanthomonadales bacterium]
MVIDMASRIAFWLGLLALLSGEAQAGLDYTLRLHGDGTELAVHLCAPDGLAAGELRSGDRDSTRWLLAIDGDGSSRPRRSGERIVHSGLSAGQCLRYRVDLRSAGRGDRYGLGWRDDAYAMQRLSDWFWRPQRIPAGTQASVAFPDGWSASLPWTPSDASGRRYRIPDTPRSWEGFSAFGRFEERRLDYPGGRLRVTLLPTTRPIPTPALLRWLDLNTRAVLTSSGRLPLADAQVLVVPLPGVRSPTPWGQVARGGGSALRLFTGLDASEAERNEDWTLSHELSHLFHPYLGDGGRWLSEGLASYYQNVLRARAGILTPERAWSKLDAGFGRGHDERSTRGQRLSEVSAGYRGTMRVYWSGAAYWLEADAALRERHGQSLDAVLERFAERHLPAYQTWSPERFTAELDRLAGTRLFVPMYQRYAADTRFPDLDDTYRRLGIGTGIQRLRSDPNAPAAAIRDAIMARSPDSVRAADAAVAR